MRLINKIICISIIFILILPIHIFAFVDLEQKLDIKDIEQDIKNEYGINIIMPREEKLVNIEKCLAVINKGLNKFPKGLLKEITNAYQKDGIETNIIIDKAVHNFFEIPAEYEMDGKSANIKIYLLSNNYYDSSIVISFDGIMDALGDLICDYLFKYYDLEILDREFRRLNAGYEYGNWRDGYQKVFVNQNSAKNLFNDISDLIWIAEAHPEKLRELGNKEVIHEKIDYLAKVFDETFETINSESKLWIDVIPDSPDSWAIDKIKYLKKESLIPDELDGKYNSYISKEDFYILLLNLIKGKLGEEYYSYFNIPKNNEGGLNFDPINRQIIVDEDIYNEHYNFYLCNNGKAIYEAYKIGLISNLDETKYISEEYISRLEAIKLSSSICKLFGINIVENSQIVNFTDLTLLNDYEKLCVYFAVNKGLVLGDGNKLKPYDYCTYQEAFILIERLYKLITYW